jgi:amidase
MGKRINAFTDDALGTMDATELAAAISTKKISVKEVTEAAIARAEKVNPTLGAIAIKMYDDARNNDKLNQDGPFYGVPTFVKDNDFIKGYPVQKGTGAFVSKVAKKNSKYVNQFFSSGVNCIGKTTMPEFGFICSTENENGMSPEIHGIQIIQRVAHPPVLLPWWPVVWCRLPLRMMVPVLLVFLHLAVVW